MRHLMELNILIVAQYAAANISSKFSTRTKYNS